MVDKLKKIKYVSLLVILVLSVSCFLACSAKQTKLDSVNLDSVGYDGEVLSWQSVDNADGYYVTVGQNPVVKVDKMAEPQLKTQILESVEVTIVAYSENVEKYLQSDEVKAALTMIPRIQKVNLTPTGFTWDAVADVSEYSVEINGEAKNETLKTNACEYFAGENNFRVKAHSNAGNKIFSVWSDPVKSVLLEKVKDITYDESVIRWSPIKDAVSYEIKIGKNTYSSTLPNLIFNASDSSFTTSIVAVGNGKDIFNSMSEDKSFTYVKPIMAAQVVDGVLSWDSVENANLYEISITQNGVTEIKSLATNSYNGLESGVNYRIKVRPVSVKNDVFSSWSNEQAVELLPCPVLSWSDQNVTWAQIEDASGFNLRILKGDTVILNTNLNSTTNVYSDLSEITGGEYQVVVQSAKSDVSTGRYSSKFSEPITIRRLLSPIGYTVKNGIELVENKRNVTLTVEFNEALYADTYDIKYNGTTFSGVLTQIENKRGFSIDTDTVAFGDNGNVEITIVAKNSHHNTINAEKIVYLNCEDINSTKILVTKLSAPKNLTIDNNVIKFENVDKASGYTLNIKNSKGEAVANYTDKLINYHEEEIRALPAGKYDVTVRTEGNGDIYISSLESSSISFVKLPPVKNVRVSDVLNSEITWEPVTYTVDGNSYAPVGYKLIVGSQEIPVQVGNSYSFKGSESKYLSVKGTNIIVYAIGDNGKNVGDNKFPTQTSIASNFEKNLLIYKLQTPSQPRVNDESMFWNVVENATSYDIFNGGTFVKNTINAQCPKSDVFTEAGTYAITIKALKNEVSGTENAYFPSESSAIKNIRVFGTPTVTFDNANGKIKWDANPMCSGYKVEIGANIYTFSNNISEYQPIISGASGEKVKISVYVIGDGGLSTLSSLPYETEMTFEKLKTITELKNNVDIKVTYNTQGATLTRNVTIEVKGATPTVGRAYAIIVGGVELVTIDNKVEFPLNSAGNFTVSARVIGGNYSPDSKICYVDSETEVVDNFTILHPVGVINLVNKKETDNTICKCLQFFKVPNATKYIYTLEYKKESGQDIDIPNITNIVLNDTTDADLMYIKLAIPKEALNVTITIKAVGDNLTVYDSTSIVAIKVVG